jgi:hypothetical protein
VLNADVAQSVYIGFQHPAFPRQINSKARWTRAEILNPGVLIEPEWESWPCQVEGLHSSNLSFSQAVFTRRLQIPQTVPKPPRYRHLRHVGSSLERLVRELHSDRVRRTEEIFGAR